MLKKVLFALTGLLVSSSLLLAQGPPNEGSLFEPVNDVPVNGGIVMMLAAGVGYGLRVLNQKRRGKQ